MWVSGDASLAGTGSPGKYARKTGAEVGSELSLALLTTIREAVASRSISLPSLNVSPLKQAWHVLLSRIANLGFNACMSVLFRNHFVGCRSQMSLPSWISWQTGGCLQLR